MKKNILSIVTALISFSGFSQMNYPIPMDSTSEWRLYVSASSGGSNYSTSSDYRVFIVGDTTIGEHVYSRLLSSGLHSFTYQGITQSTPFENEFYAFIRTDSARTYKFFDGHDELLYDFSLQAGDTLPITIINWSPTVIIASVDTILIAGKYLKKFNLFDPGGSLNSSWYVEGIGHENGLDAPMNIMFDNGYSFECYAENHVPVFPDGSTCDLTVDIVERPVANETILTYPNPSEGIFTVTLNADTEKKLFVKIMGVSGNLIMSDTWHIKQGLNKHVFNLSGTSAGIYVLFLHDGNSIIHNKIVLTE
ncbi:MAG: T9SS type A sorting domain-containing protein [Lentimicrobium sp.]|nr:T9SS type A sorting domain-containing protein [Lentimicrobium sp.]